MNITSTLPVQFIQKNAKFIIKKDLSHQKIPAFLKCPLAYNNIICCRYSRNISDGLLHCRLWSSIYWNAIKTRTVFYCLFCACKSPSCFYLHGYGSGDHSTVSAIKCQVCCIKYTASWLTNRVPLLVCSKSKSIITIHVYIDSYHFAYELKKLPTTLNGYCLLWHNKWLLLAMHLSLCITGLSLCSVDSPLCSFNKVHLVFLG